MLMQWLRLGLGVLVLAVSTGVQAVWTTPDGLWSITVIETGRANYPASPPASYEFNGRRSVNASGLSMYDVPAPVLGLIDESLEREAINDSGLVVGELRGWTADYSLYYNHVVLFDSTSTTFTFVPGWYRANARALGNSGAVLVGDGGYGSYIVGGPQPPVAFYIQGFGEFVVDDFWDINDRGQILATIGLAQSTPDPNAPYLDATVIFSPAPEPHALLLLAGSIAVLHRVRRPKR